MPIRREFIWAFAAALLAMLVLDALWISLVALPMFRARLGAVMAPSPVLGAVVAFYVIYAFGLVTLAVRPALASRSLRTAISSGAILGLTAYATFDLTNLAILAPWSLDLATLDIAWGVVISGLAAAAGFAAGRLASTKSGTTG
ncbi:MAG: DUF2177 family protein [Proteobacteria bacterium]|nr:DUF2177 family protein [Pseudomonadota bacterium]